MLSLGVNWFSQYIFLCRKISQGSTGSFSRIFIKMVSYSVFCYALFGGLYLRFVQWIQWTLGVDGISLRGLIRNTFQFLEIMHIYLLSLPNRLKSSFSQISALSLGSDTCSQVMLGTLHTLNFCVLFPQDCCAYYVSKTLPSSQVSALTVAP